jgi:hypothetical protein
VVEMKEVLNNKKDNDINKPCDFINTGLLEKRKKAQHDAEVLNNCNSNFVRGILRGVL